MSVPLLNFEWVEITCETCGLHFRVEKVWHDHRLRTGSSFRCPNGDSLAYEETAVDRLKKELAAKEVELARQRVRAERSERQLVAARGQVTKIKNRVGNGVCPCCRRSFQNLQRHMGNQHPDWKTQEVGG